jgi:hypothetical protein
MKESTKESIGELIAFTILICLIIAGLTILNFNIK